MLNLGHILISNLVVANLLMHSLSDIIMYLAPVGTTFLNQVLAGSLVS